MNHTIQRFITLIRTSNVNFDICKNISTTLTLSNWVPTSSVRTTKYYLKFHRNYSINVHSKQLGDNIDNLKILKNKSDNSCSPTQLKKRPKKRKSLTTDEETNNAWNVKAWATSEEYDLQALVEGLNQQKLYIPNIIATSISSLPDVIHAIAKYEVEHEPKEIFFFQEGSIVMWNMSDIECDNVLNFLKKYEQNSYKDTIIQAESENMCYSYTEVGKCSHIKNGKFILASNATNLDKYTFSNAMAQSVKLGVWEASLDNYIESIEFVTEDLKCGRKLKLTQHEVLKKQGELFALRHSINLSSDLLDIPDFYWERDDLERLYQEICSYFNIAKRTRVINEKLNHCVELVAILSSHLSDRHHIRLEWMIIILIMVEVAFEILHYVDKYFS